MKKKKKRSSKRNRRPTLKPFEQKDFGQKKSEKVKQTSLTHGNIPLSPQLITSDSTYLWKVERSQVEAGIRGALDLMDSLQEMSFRENSITIAFDGYDEDSRELWEIFDIKNFLLSLIVSNPKKFFELVPEESSDGLMSQVLLVAWAFAIQVDHQIPLELVECIKNLLLYGQWPEKYKEHSWSSDLEPLIAKQIWLARKTIADERAKKLEATDEN